MDTLVMSDLDLQGRSEGSEHREHRRWSAEDKRRIVAESFAGDVSVSQVARRHDLNANMLFSWRQEARRGAIPMLGAGPGFVPAKIVSEPVAAPPSRGSATGRMEIVLRGGARVIVTADVDASALERVLKVLAHR